MLTKTTPKGQKGQRVKPGARERKAHRLFMRRTANIYRHQKRRAGGSLDYTLQELRDAVERKPRCPLCHEEEPIPIKEISLDHATPIERGGAFWATNIWLTHARCNQAKGILTATEYRALRSLAEMWPLSVRRDLFARLRAGSARIYGRKE